METATIITPVSTRGLRLGDQAPNFRARTTMGEISLEDYRGRWLLFFSHPGDFTPVCTSEFLALARAASRFDAMGCELLGLSVDSLYSHLAWMRAIRDAFDVVVPFPVIEDPSMAVGRAYGMLDDKATDASSVRASYFIDPDGIIRAITWYPANVGRSVDELLRTLAALRRTTDSEALTPEGWRPGDPLLRPAAQSQEMALSDGDDQPWFHRLEPGA